MKKKYVNNYFGFVKFPPSCVDSPVVIVVAVVVSGRCAAELCAVVAFAR